MGLIHKFGSEALSPLEFASIRCAVDLSTETIGTRDRAEL